MFGIVGLYKYAVGDVESEVRTTQSSNNHLHFSFLEQSIKALYKLKHQSASKSYPKSKIQFHSINLSTRPSRTLINIKSPDPLLLKDTTAAEQRQNFILPTPTNPIHHTTSTHLQQHYFLEQNVLRSLHHHPNLQERHRPFLNGRIHKLQRLGPEGYYLFVVFDIISITQLRQKGMESCR